RSGVFGTRDCLADMLVCCAGVFRQQPPRKASPKWTLANEKTVVPRNICSCSRLRLEWFIRFSVISVAATPSGCSAALGHVRRTPALGILRARPQQDGADGFGR